MRLKRNGFQLPRISIDSGDSGQVTMVAGLFFTLFLGILLVAQLQLEQVRATSSYTEDALAASGLAGALADLKEYGRSHQLIISDRERAYEEYLLALRTNLGLNLDWECENKRLISGRVLVEDYIIYNVTGKQVMVYTRKEDGWSSSQGCLGEVRTPQGQLVEHTGIYSRISFPLKGMFGMEVRTKMGKLVDIVGN